MVNIYVDTNVQYSRITTILALGLLFYLENYYMPAHYPIPTRSPTTSSPSATPRHSASSVSFASNVGFVEK